MEVVGCVASVVALIEATGKIFKICSQIKNARAEKDLLIEEAENIQKIMLQVQTLVAQNPAQLPTLEAFEPEIIKCQKQLQYVQDGLQAQVNTSATPGKSKISLTRLTKKFQGSSVKWVFEKEEWTSIFDYLRNFRGNVSLAFHIEHSKRLISIEGSVTGVSNQVTSLQISVNNTSNQTTAQFTTLQTHIDANFKALKDLDAKRQQQENIKTLPYTHGAAFNSSPQDHERLCLPDTRVDILQLISDWSISPTSPYIFWLNGMAGTGKSTIARTISQKFDTEKSLGASFFFGRGVGDRSSAKNFFSSLALQLSNSIPDLAVHVSNAITQVPRIDQLGMAEQYKQLVVEPFTHISINTNYFIVVDALDECNDMTEAKLIVRLISEIRISTIRFFVTSRPENDIRSSFQENAPDFQKVFALHEIPLDITNHDISLFLEYEFNQISKRHRRLPKDWVDAKTIEKLTIKSEGLFIYASTVCRYIGDPKWDPVERLRLVLEDSKTGRALDRIYLQILVSAVFRDCNEDDEDEMEELVTRFQKVIGTIVILVDTLSINALADLCRIGVASVGALVDSLNSVLDVSDSDDRPIQLLHASFSEFLLDSRRCTDRDLFVKDADAHKSTLEDCLKIMQRFLKKDILNIQYPGVSNSHIEEQLRNKNISMALDYASRHWLDHLLFVLKIEPDYLGISNVPEFLNKSFLNWLEITSLIGNVSNAIAQVKGLKAILELHKKDEIYEVFHDTERFMLHFRSMIEESPLQIYHSGLIYSPKNSWIKQNYSEESNEWVSKEVIHGEQEAWSPCILTLECPSSQYHHQPRLIEFSPNDKMIASLDDGGYVHIWDRLTGALMHTLYSPERDSIFAFSNDSKLLASGNPYDQLCSDRIKIWDTQTGTARNTIKTSGRFSRRFCFSPDDRYIFTGDNSGRIEVWEVETGICEKVVETCQSAISALVLSKDGTILAVGSKSGELLTWNTATWKSRKTLRGHEDEVMTIAFAPNSRQIASGSLDKTIRIWDIRIGRNLQTLNDDYNIAYITYFRNGEALISSSSLGYVRLWDVNTGTCLKHFSSAMGAWKGEPSIRGSPKGKLLVTSFMENLAIWDGAVEADVGTFVGHSGSIQGVAYSSDGELVASCCTRGTVRLWNMIPYTREREQEEIYETAERSWWMIELNPFKDEDIMLFPKNTTNVGVWEAATSSTRAIELAVNANLDSIWAIAVSPCYSFIATYSDEASLAVWYSSTGEYQNSINIPKLHSSLKFNFSPDSRFVMLLASVSFSRDQIQLYDRSKGLLKLGIGQERKPDRGVLLSNDSRFILTSEEGQGQDRIWDVDSSNNLCRIEGNFEKLDKSAVFSPDCQQIAILYYRVGMLRLWRTQTGETLKQIELETLNPSVSFGTTSYLFSPIGPVLFNEKEHLTKHMIEFRDEWLIIGSYRLLWIPPTYRLLKIGNSRPEYTVNNKGNIIALRDQFDEIYVLRLDIELLIAQFEDWDEWRNKDKYKSWIQLEEDDYNQKMKRLQED